MRNNVFNLGIIVLNEKVFIEIYNSLKYATHFKLFIIKFKKK